MQKDLVKTIDDLTMTTYARQPVTFVSGQGENLTDAEGKSYLDFLAGIAVCNLGHCHPEVTRAIVEQTQKLVHVCNLFYTEPQAKVAEFLVNNSFADRVFFCNSGAEANEGALKLTRLWGKERLNGAYGIITMEKSFHGRTLKTLSATGQKKIQEGFEPLSPGFTHVPFDDLGAVERAWGADTCAVLVEPVLGEGGVMVPSKDYLSGLKDICEQRDGLLIFDEIQTGLGRTGKLFAYEHFGVTPHVMTLAKGLANGLPAGAVLAEEKVAKLFTPGKHGTTFGAGPVVMAAAGAVLAELTKPGFLDQVNQKAAYFKARLQELADRHGDKIKQVRGLGMMLGIQLAGPGGPLVSELLDRGFVVNCTQDTVLRFLPPLVVSQKSIDALTQALDQALAGWQPGIKS